MHIFIIIIITFNELLLTYFLFTYKFDDLFTLIALKEGKSNRQRAAALSSMAKVATSSKRYRN